MPESEKRAVVSLDKLRLSNVEQVRMAYELLRLQEPVIEFFLLRLFPQYMRHQQVKLHPQLSSSVTHFNSSSSSPLMLKQHDT